MLNIERNDTDNYYSDVNMTDNPNLLRVSITLTGKQGTDKDSPIKPGEYPARRNATDIYDNVLKAEVEFIKDGKVDDVFF